jgi:hypothetical protein
MTSLTYHCYLFHLCPVDSDCLLWKV